ncbi:MAG TPA: DUF3486 family protein [Rhizobiales bacterium]|nr:DUF3486 family protein [Hyphomicrobiales bacterium]
MPPIKKVDQLPEETRDWLKQALKDGGFSGYEEIANDLNQRLEEGGHSLRLHRASVQRFGAEYKEFVKYQEEAGAWAADWMNDQGLEDEANRHSVLFQMLTSLAFKFMKSEMREDKVVDPKELHFIGRMMKDIMASSGMREQLIAKEAERIKAEERASAADVAGKAAKQAGMSADTVEEIKAVILGVEK